MIKIAITNAIVSLFLIDIEEIFLRHPKRIIFAQNITDQHTINKQFIVLYFTFLSHKK